MNISKCIKQFWAVENLTRIVQLFSEKSKSCDEIGIKILVELNRAKLLE